MRPWRLSLFCSERVIGMRDWETKAADLHDLQEITLGLASQRRPCLCACRSALRHFRSLPPCRE
eukprot:4771909-Pyramimonas_sp.AAC.1